jgi:outer membrane protein assembly factor BamB
MSGTTFGIALSFALLTVGRSEDWPQFRGPKGTGVGADTPIPLEWSSDKNIAWKAAVPGSGWSQPVIIGNLVFVTSAITDRP